MAASGWGNFDDDTLHGYITNVSPVKEGQNKLKNKSQNNVISTVLIQQTTFETKEKL